jgi:hypothetical protein
MDVRRFVLTGLRPKLDRYLIYAYERLVNFALNSPHVNGTGKGFVDAYMLFNMNGFSRRTHSCLACEVLPFKRFQSIGLQQMENGTPRICLCFLVASGC